MSLTAVLLHHSESIDPTLIDWIRHEIDDVLGLGPETIVAVLGALIVAFPVGLMIAARRVTPPPNPLPAGGEGEDGSKSPSPQPLFLRESDPMAGVSREGELLAPGQAPRRRSRLDRIAARLPKTSRKAASR